MPNYILTFRRSRSELLLQDKIINWFKVSCVMGGSRGRISSIFSCGCTDQTWDVAAAQIKTRLEGSMSFQLS